MTRKDYKKFAEMMEALQHTDLNPYFNDAQLIYLFKELNHIFKSDNSNFSKEKFYEASFGRKSINDLWRIGKI
jgi:hypothetical protein